MRSRLLTPVLALVLLLAAPACGGDDGGGGEAGGGSGSGTAGDPAGAEGPEIPADAEWDDRTGEDVVVIRTRDNSFTPRYVRVSAGATLRFENEGRNDHNVLPAEEGAFVPIEAPDLQPDEAAELPLPDPGLLPYYCSLHGTARRGMTAVVEVVAEEGMAPASVGAGAALR